MVAQPQLGQAAGGGDALSERELGREGGPQVSCSVLLILQASLPVGNGICSSLQLGKLRLTETKYLDTVLRLVRKETWV